MKYLLGMLLVASMAVTGYAQDPGTNSGTPGTNSGTNFNGSDNNYNDYTQSSTKGSQDKFDASGSKKDMNNSSNMNSPLYMENGNYNDYTQSSTKGSQDKFDANGSKKDMNNSSNMNSPLYMENGTLAEPKTEGAYGNSQDRNSQNLSREQKMNAKEADNDPNGSKAGNALDKAGAKSKKGISKGWDKVKHNKLTKHLFNQPRNS
jgi:hypothetical protein